jgi:serine/threonine protein kinase
MELTPGSVVAGRYRVDRKIGSGGMGEVWAGEHVTVGVRVALKTLLPAAACDPQIVARFRREAHVLGRLRSDRVARVVDFVEDKRVGLVLVMDLVDGEPLGVVLAARTFGVEEAVDLGVDIMAAVCDLHRAKIVHRDLKPDNIILEPRGDGGRRRAVIVDFGVSRVQHSAATVDDSLTNITMADMAVGTLLYMAPEQLLSSRDATGSADLYAVGAILFRAVSGGHVFGDVEDVDYVKRKLTGPAPPLPLRRIDRVAHGLVAVVARALERRPEERYESADVMLRDLSDLQELARATAMDLDAPTEEAPHLMLSAALFSAPRPPIAADEEKTGRISLPPDTLVEELFVESTLESPGTALAEAPPSAAATERDPGPPPGADAHARSPSDAPTRLSLPPRSIPAPIPSSLGARPTQLSPEPLRAAVPVAVPLPGPPPSAPWSGPVRPHLVAIPLWAAMIGMIAAMVLGAVMGFEAHRWLGAPVPAEPASPGR